MIRKIFTRRELTAGQRFLRSGMQLGLSLGLFLSARGLASGAYWLYSSHEQYSLSAFAPLSPVVTLAALVAGPMFCIGAAIMADRLSKSQKGRKS